MANRQSGSFGIRAFAAIMVVCVTIGQCLPARALDTANIASSLPTRLNLASTRRTGVAPQSLAEPVKFRNGGESQTVTAGMPLTPAQLAAVLQILATGTQSIVLGPRGNAIAGSLVLGTSQTISSLRVPHGVTIVRDFGAGTTLSMNGNLANAGTFYALSTTPTISNAVISAHNITNSTGGLITTVLPAGGLTGFAGASPNLNLSLVATNNLVNSGVISSAGSLNLVAGNQIVNSSTAGTPALFSALGDVNIGTSSLVNGGLIQSTNANIAIVQQIARNAELSALAAQLGQQQGAFSTPTGVADLSINNLGGTLEALNGSIIIDHSLALKNTTVDIGGGDLLGKTMDVDAGAGRLIINVSNLTGRLNITAGRSNVGETTGSLTLGDMHFSGDPTFWTANNIDVTVDESNLGAALTFLAGGNINFHDSTLQTRNSLGNNQGFNITAIAGAALTPPPPALPQPLLSGTVKVTGHSATGGAITCDGCRIDASSNGSGALQNGGNVLLAAYTDASGFLGGFINLHTGLNTSPIFTNAGSDGGQAGSVTIIASKAITVDNVIMIGTRGTPKLTIITAQPTGTITADFTGAIKGTLKPSNTINSTALLAVNGAVFDLSGTAICKAGNLQLLDGSTFSVSSGVSGRSGGTISLTSSTLLTLGGDISASGFTGTPGAAGAAGMAGGAGGKGSNGGAITLAAAGLVNLVSPFTMESTGGIGGAAGPGGAGNASQPKGGAGGSGGTGGSGGKITITGPDASLTGALFDVSGGHGGLSAGGGSAAAGGAGGAGGNGGAGGKAGTVSIKLTDKSTALPEMKANGGPGADGSIGGLGSSAGTKGGAGGAGGKGGAGGAGGIVTLSCANTATLHGDHTINISSIDIDASGGAGGNSGAGRTGGSGAQTGGAGGVSQSGGAGGAGGKFSLTANGIEFTSSALSEEFTVQVSGGGGGNSLNGGSGNLIAVAGNGGAGGNAGSSGKGGGGGSITMVAKDGSIRPETGSDALSLSSSGGSSGTVGQGGEGGDGGISGGKGGSTSQASAGGNAGSIKLQAKFNVQMEVGFASSKISLLGGGGGPIAANPAGDGGTGGTGAGGSGGTGGAGGKGGAGGSLTISSSLGLVACGVIFAEGGFGSEGSAGGAGSRAGLVTGQGGSGGAGGAGGSGGKGGNIHVTAHDQIFLRDDFFAFGGSGGDGASGGAAESGIVTMGVTGGTGGAGGKGASGGSGGNVTLKTSSPTAGLVAFDGATNFASGGGGGGGGAGGVGGYGIQNGGNGGAGGSSGNGGAGGNVSATARVVDLFNPNSISAKGGDAGSMPVPTSGGNGGKGTISPSTGGNGGNAAAGGVGGQGGKVTFKSTFALSATGTINVNGGDGADSSPGGNGGSGPGPLGAIGGDGGHGGNGGNGGNGGTITLISPSSTITTPNMLFEEGLGGNNSVGGSKGGAGGTDGQAGKFGVEGKDGKLITDASEAEDEEALAIRRAERRGTRARSMTRVANGSHTDLGDNDPLKLVAFVEPMLTLSDRQISAANVLLSADRQRLSVRAGFARVDVTRGAAAFVVNNGRDVTVLALHEHATGDVRLLLSEQEIKLRTGEQVVITSANLDFADVNPTAGVAVRHQSERSLADGTRVLMCEFSLGSAITNLGALKRLANSPDDHEHALFGKLLKNAAILQTISVGKGPYRASLPRGMMDHAI